MDWSNESFVRLYTRETVDDALLSWEARAVWHELLKRFDRAGIIELGPHGWRGVAALIRMPVGIVEKAGPELETDGRLEVRGQYLLAPNFLPAQEASKSDRQRQAESRAKRRAQARATELGLVTDCDGSVTNRDTESRDVTEPSQPVTTGHSDLCSADLTFADSLCPSADGRGGLFGDADPEPEKPRFDFDAIYADYPCKKGKAKGMEAIPKKVRDQADYERLRACVEWMAKAWKGADVSKCPMWSTFVNGVRWRDELWPAPLTPSRRPGEPDPSSRYEPL